ncbi:hypothetical protein O3P69_015356 [Scylla paramamosain]|uniref:Uncharacterized protein n=1 Tax=Scylla paramamosain TaxID=85552 RepID=A0AAW0T4Q6_SCYPA
MGDFGLVTTIAEEEQQAAYTPATHLQRFPTERTHTHRVGTRLYMSPEQSSLLKLMLSQDPACRPNTHGLRARRPLCPLQGHSVEDILPEDHFCLSRQRSHFTASSSSTTSLSASSTTST